MTHIINGDHHQQQQQQPAQQGFSTRAIHVGSSPDPSTSAVIPPISLSTTFAQSSIGVHKGFEYARSSNPTRGGLEQALAALEAGGSHALAFASGSATTATVVQSLGPGAHILSVNDVYGGTYRYFTSVAPAQGVSVDFLDLASSSAEQVERDISTNLRPNTKLIWIESPTNPTLRVINIQQVASVLARQYSHSPESRPLILVDNTFSSPYYASPLLSGADVVLHSLTKYVNGHSDVIAGALILPAHHFTLYQKLQYFQNAIGAILSPMDSYLVQRGGKTLAVRMKEHGLNALKAARYLSSHPLVEEVIYPGLPSHPSHRVAWDHLSPHAKKWIKTLPASLHISEESGFPYSGMVSFRVKGGAEEARKFVENTKIFTLAESLGGVESLVEVPAGMTHGSIPLESRLKLGITDSLIRLSVGIEDTEDQIEDIEQALRIAVPVTTTNTTTIEASISWELEPITKPVISSPLLTNGFQLPNGRTTSRGCADELNTGITSPTVGEMEVFA